MPLDTRWGGDERILELPLGCSAGRVWKVWRRCQRSCSSTLLVTIFLAAAGERDQSLETPVAAAATSFLSSCCELLLMSNASLIWRSWTSFGEP